MRVNFLPSARIFTLITSFVLLSTSSAFAAKSKGLLAFTAVPDEYKAIATLVILLIAAILFFTEVIPLPVTAMLVPIMLSLTGVIGAKEAFANFGNQWVVIFMAMFIVGHAVFITGFAEKIGNLTMVISKGSEKRLLIFSMVVVGLLSSLLSNTGTIVVAIPMILAMCSSSKIDPRRILMPVAFACSIGGTITLVGTPPNGFINTQLDIIPGIEPFGFFEFALIGIPLFLVTIGLYTLLGERIQPKSLPADPDAEVDLKMDNHGEKTSNYRYNKMPVATVIFAGIIIFMATSWLPLIVAAMLGACLMIITRCITMKEAYEGIDWTTIFLFAGMLSMSTAMDKSGAAKLVADIVVSNISSPYLLLAAVCCITVLITNFMSNTATAALMAPLAIPIALGAGISPLPMAMGIAMSASACFLTPVATPPNTIILGYGRYSFIDYLRYGWVLQVAAIVTIVGLVPLIWPFTP